NRLQMLCNCLIVFLLILSVDSRPSMLETPGHPGEYNGDLSEETIHKIQQCEKDLPTMELCMRCAKVTKSSMIYPMCCSNDDGIKDWCNAYVFYGEQ
ncbi:hypothetical protein KR009_005531, partial [Drosophila setifemur]